MFDQVVILLARAQIWNKFSNSRFNCNNIKRLSADKNTKTHIKQFYRSILLDSLLFGLSMKKIIIIYCTYKLDWLISRIKIPATVLQKSNKKNNAFYFLSILGAKLTTFNGVVIHNLLFLR